jgi:DNA mismatch repair protein MutS
VRKQTTKNAERYVTDELRTFESKVLKAEENGKALEYELFVALRERVAQPVGAPAAHRRAVAELDAFAGSPRSHANATTAARSSTTRWCCASKTDATR